MTRLKKPESLPKNRRIDEFGVSLAGAELRHLLDSACLSFLGTLPTFAGFSHGKI